MTLFEMEGFLRGKCLPGDMKVNESNAQYLVRKFSELQSQNAELAVQLANAESKCRELAAENVGLKAGIGFFSYDSSGFYEEHDTAENAAAYAEDSISEYRDNAPDGWSDEVGSVVWGVIMQRATMTGLRPVTEGDNVPSHIEEWCDYTLLPDVKTQATDAFLAEVRAQGVDVARNALIKFVEDEVGPNTNVPGLIRGAEVCVSIAAQLRKGAAL